MPELPEVETVRRGLEPAMKDRILLKVDVNRPNLRWPFPKNMDERLTGRQVLRLRRRSKYLLIDLCRSETLLIHLGMSGRMTVSRGETAPATLGHYIKNHEPIGKHDHVVFHMEGDLRVTFNDPRRFGAMDILKTANEASHKLIASIGPEPLGNEFNADQLFEKLTGKTAPIKSALLDQRIVAGLGNIYVCESLWRSGISPKRKSGQISKNRIETLVTHIRVVLKEAITAGGSSLQDHRQTSGELGYFQHSFAVYGQENEPCRAEKCNTKIKRIVQSGRSSFYCSNCQK